MKYKCCLILVCRFLYMISGFSYLCKQCYHMYVIFIPKLVIVAYFLTAQHSNTIQRPLEGTEYIPSSYCNWTLFSAAFFLQKCCNEELLPWLERASIPTAPAPPSISHTVKQLKLSYDRWGWPTRKRKERITRKTVRERNSGLSPPRTFLCVSVNLEWTVSIFTTTNTRILMIKASEHKIK